MIESDIVIRCAREHNLRNVSLRLPRNKLIAMTGVSGSGKSSLAFDTLYAEGQRRYVESLSSYARQFLGQMPKPDVDSITGLAPSISIQQKTSGRNPRSTVGTITEIYDYLRVLFARVGLGHCPQCERPITAQTREQILESLLKLPEGTLFQILAPMVQRQKGEYRDLCDDLLRRGFLRARIDGRFVQLNENLQLDRQMRHTIDVVVDRLKAGAAGRTRLAEAVETALRLSGGSLIVSLAAPAGPPGGDRPTAKPTVASARKRTKKPRVEVDVDEASPDAEGSNADAPPVSMDTQDRLYSSHYACTHCGLSYEPPSPQLFSFNSPQGMCPDCNGLGMRHDFRLDVLIPDETLSFKKGAVSLLGSFKEIGRWRRHILEGAALALERDHDMKEGTALTTPWSKLPAGVRDGLLYGLGDRNITFSWKHRGGVWKHGAKYDGIIPELRESYRTAKNPMRRRQLEKYMEFMDCGHCAGSRLNPQARSVRLTTSSTEFLKHASRKDLSLSDVCGLTIAEAAEFFTGLELDDTGQLIAEEVLKEIRGRLGFLLRCGLDYLTLDRAAPTLSGGESQRIRLAGQIGCGLVGVLYILDEPSIGLHPRDNDMLLGSLLELRDLGNTVVVVEHDEETIRAADHVIDFGPGPGVRGGEVIGEGTLDELKANPRSITGQYLSGKLEIAVPKDRRKRSDKELKIVSARHNNLRGVDVSIPLESFVCVTGVSGSGKSSLVNDILWEVLNRDLNKGDGAPGEHAQIVGLDLLDKAINIDQSPIGRTPRSNPATYVKLFDQIRDLYTRLPESKLRGYKAGRFSFNVADGRCEACEGHGATKLEMDFLADIWVTCPVCAGNRFNHETLEVRFKGANIAEVLEMDVQQALEHFENIPKLVTLLRTLRDVGLDYLKLGQASPTLSGGEAQRIKLARELGKRSTGRTIYLLDEPTTGLHFADIHKLLEVLHSFCEAGNTVLVVEHNLDVIKTADWVIDLGPEGGRGGGTIVAEGTPEDVAKCDKSHTGRALAKLLFPKKKASKAIAGPRIDPRHVAARHSSEALDPAATRTIMVRGATQHNLQNVTAEIPRHQMSVFCGPSGSGKTSLAMDTLYAEGQRRYVESLSSYARQFLGQMPKPRVEHISGLSPAVAIEQKTVGHSPRSTVGTVTEIYDYMRILFARLGKPYCPECDVPIETQTTDEVIAKILTYPAGSKLLIMSPQEVEVGDSYEKLWAKLRSQGFLRVRVDGATYRLEDVPEFDRRRMHHVEIIIDRITVSAEGRSRLAESVESALDRGQGWMHVARVQDDTPESNWQVDWFCLHNACTQCGESFETLNPHNFSFNSPLGWCPACEGLGVQQGTNIAALVADPKRTLSEGAISAWPDPRENEMFARMLKAMSRQLGLPLDVPFQKLDPRHQRMVLYGTGEQWIELETGGLKVQYKGLYPAIDEASRVSVYYRSELDHLVGEVACSVCHGARTRTDAAAVRLNGQTLLQLCELPLDECLDFFRSIKFKAAEKRVAGDLLHEVTNRLSFLVDVGLHYLTLSRTMPTLSGGESQRIRLAGQIGRALTGVLYVLDEPTIGLHPRDNGKLLQALKHLRDLGNTVILVEHDREVLEAADRLYDFGPGAGRFGGTIVGRGTPRELVRQDESLTGKYLSGREAIPIPKTRRITLEPVAAPTNGKMSKKAAVALDPAAVAPSDPPGGGWLEIRGARHHNLRDVDLRIPLGTLTCVTGVSGSGKSSLIEETLAKAVARRLHNSREPAGQFEELVGLNKVNKVIQVDQQPLGSTPASNPATYTGVFEHIRELFARLPDSKIRGYRPARFSFNRPGGRCEACEGNGQKCIEMHFLPDVWVECDTCRGRRFNEETLAVKFHGKSISDVLEMSIGQARDLFENVPKIRGILATLCAVGLDYLTLGQSAATLSGGEAQRVKLAAELARPQTGKTLYILDEPTTGLHFDDIRKLLLVLDSLVELGNTVVVIEHNLDVIKTADWIIDLGPEAGNEGGWIVAEGTPEMVVAQAAKFAEQTRPATRKKAVRIPKAAEKTADVATKEPVKIGLDGTIPFRSYTGELLAPLLHEGDRQERAVFDVQEASRKRKGDLDLHQVGKDAPIPWQVDGRRWHTVDRISHTGKPSKWEGDALGRVIDRLEANERFDPTNWNAPALVEMGAKQAGGWFLHALTGNEWLLTLKFRMAKGTFQQEPLEKALALKPLDDLDEIPVYGDRDRVSVKNLPGPWQEVTITVHWLKEIDTPAFWKFLDQAADAYLGNRRDKLNLDDLTPWKVLAKKWHVSRKGFPTGKRVQWEVEVLTELADLLEQSLPGCRIDWTGQQAVYFHREGSDATWATLYTKRRGGVDLCFVAEAGQFALGRISNCGDEREISPTSKGAEQVRIRFSTTDQLAVSELRELLRDLAGLPAVQSVG